MVRCDVFEPLRYEGGGSLEIHGERISYHTVSEDTVFYDGCGKPIASVFSFSYFRNDVPNPENRPVIFAFNGGPGTSSFMLHAGFLGTKRVSYSEDVDSVSGLPPYAVSDNMDCLLDTADIVLYDPVGTGFGTLLDESRGEEFFGIEKDAEIFLCFVEKWLQRYNRWLSPKYVIGESYGCTRAATAAGIATRRSPYRSYDFAFDGIVFIGSTVTTGKYFSREVPVEPSVLSIPSLAAVNWYHNTDHSTPVGKWVEEAKSFADSEYLLALYLGRRLEAEKKVDIQKKLMYYTGVSEEYLKEHGMRIDVLSYRSEVIKNKGRSVSKLDARLTRPLYEPETDEYTYLRDPDAISKGKYNTAFVSVLQGSIFPVLGIENCPRLYVPSAPLNKKWDYEAELTTAKHLYNAMQRTPGMRAFFASGYYDMTTEIGVTEYMLDHASLPSERVFHKGYSSGHMIYIGNDTCRELSEDIRVFINGRCPVK